MEEAGYFNDIINLGEETDEQDGTIIFNFLNAFIWVRESISNKLLWKR